MTSLFRPNSYEVAEITWENGQLAMHGHGRASDTLESIVHQATAVYHQSQTNDINRQQSLPATHNITSTAASSSRKWGDSSAGPCYLKKRPRTPEFSHEQCERNHGTRNLNEDTTSISVTINSKENDTTMMTWPSFDSPNWSFKTADNVSAAQYRSEKQEEECKTEGETVRSHSARRNRAAAIHNQSERRRRERINQKIRALQQLVPNANKTDKASMLDEVIDYLKKLQAQLQLMKNMQMPPQMMISLPLQLQQQQQQQQQLQMSMLARMGMGVGLQMGIPGVMPAAGHHPFMVPQPVITASHVGGTSQAIRQHSPAATTTIPFGDPYTAFLAQSMNMDMYNNMAAFYQQQVSQAAKSRPSTSQANHVHGNDHN